MQASAIELGAEENIITLLPFFSELAGWLATVLPRHWPQWLAINRYVVSVGTLLVPCRFISGLLLIVRV